MMKLLLIPLDERPVNTRYPRMIAAVAGIDLELPPPDLLSHYRQPADADALIEWLRVALPNADGVIASVETLVFGGLIPSRNENTPTLSAVTRASALAHMGEKPIYAFNVITRIPDYNDDIEEPPYWATYGARIHRYSALSHRADLGHPVKEERAAVRGEIPDGVIEDFTRRRLRNHLINLHMLDHAVRGAFNVLVISSDDTSEFGMGSQEKAWISTWARRLEMSDTQLLMYPGADEVGSVLLMRAALQLAGKPVPTFYVDYAIDEDKHVIAPYEDSPVHVTVERQIKALGGEIVTDPDTADFIVSVNTPARISMEYLPTHPLFNSEIARRAPYLAPFVERAHAWVNAEKKVIVCDVAYPNGSDPDLLALMFGRIDLRRLASYGAWNTAGNTIGVALAHGVASAQANTPQIREMHQRFLLHRFIEDWGYQHLVRDEIRGILEATSGRRDTTPDTEAEAIKYIEKGVNELLPRLGSLSDGWRITQVRLPWNRTFEVDFEVSRL